MIEPTLAQARSYVGFEAVLGTVLRNKSSGGNTSSQAIRA
jgi:hypothetical protein